MSKKICRTLDHMFYIPLQEEKPFFKTLRPWIVDGSVWLAGIFLMVDVACNGLPVYGKPLPVKIFWAGKYVR